MANQIVQVKSILSSKTFWLNSIATAIAAVTAISGQSWVQENPNVVEGFVAVVGLLNVALRFVTKQPIG